MAAENCKFAQSLDFESLSEVADTVGCRRSWIYDTGLRNPLLLRALIIGAAEIRKQQEQERFRR